MDMTVEVPELPELTFDEASHIYRLNGDIIPSVSKLMEPLKDQCYGSLVDEGLLCTEEFVLGNEKPFFVALERNQAAVITGENRVCHDRVLLSEI